MPLSNARAVRSHHVASLTADKVREILVNQIHRTGHLNTHADLIISEQAAAGLTVLIYGLNPGTRPSLLAHPRCVS